jgi:hypothetical protein
MRALVLALVCLVWISGVIAGLGILVEYSNAQGSPSAPQARWPAESALQREADRATLVMLVHPHCPCTRASIGELAIVMRHCLQRVKAHVLFVRPAGMPEDWEKADLWSSAAAIPGVEVRSDPEGWEARRFGAATSGAVLLYDTRGALIFQGGITAARGHSGENAGRSSVVALLTHAGEARARTPVFGCPLFGEACTCPAAGESEGQPCHHP